jgi:excisionase family DNA binding protein
MTTKALDDRPGTAETVLIDVKAVAQLLGCSSRHVVRMQDAGQMPPPVKLGRLSRWSRKAIEEWIADGCKAVRRTGS